MMVKALSDIQQTSCREVQLWVFEENNHARKFYEKMGFKNSQQKQQCYDNAIELKYVKVF